MTIKSLFTLLFVALLAITTRSQSKTLVTYFSHSGNTKVVAEYIQDMTGADIFRIEPADEYPQDYKTLCDQAKKEINEHYYPNLKNSIESIASYDTIFVGTPNWWNTMAPPVATFLTLYNFDGKVIIPFCTHGGGGKGHIFEDMTNLCPNSEFKEGYSVNGDLVNDCKSDVKKWLKKVTSSDN